ncbi:Ribonuclease P protein subunit p30 [Penicillium ucsense]|uniref:Ribonuclease P protein subunit p30 n=1 Tax=Penicillium ucsense TaxID=2839758 RepID=A0A8J8W5I3_9EURO|nr:Ribonuclease P protein subunit p30 [Penicillium ucsense]KAF7735302.1 Ribonuclease P protein subunit p30 [Penicillium ucsense]
MFFDLNVPYSQDDPEALNTLNFLAELGYTTVALSQTVTGKLPTSLTPPTLPSNAPKSLQLLTRLNLTLSDTAQNQRLNSLTQAYDIVALRPTNEKTLLNACTTLECDMISLDLSVRLPFHFKFKMLSAALSRGIRLEICYGPGVTGTGLDARRNLIGNAMSLIRATRGGRGIIVSSEARRALSLRAPWDVINLTCVWGLSQERGKEAICEEARKVTALAKLKRTSWRGIVDIVHGGEKVATDNANPKSKGEKKTFASKESDSTPDSLKRKASLGSEAAVEPEKPLSKREMKRRAKKARLEPQAADAS